MTAPLLAVVHDPDQPTEITSTNGDLTLRLPAGVAPVPFQLSVQPAALPTTTLPSQPLRAIQIDITTVQGQSVTTFAQPLTIAFRLSRDELSRINAATLTIYWSRDGATWHSLATVVDTASGTATARVDHLTIFALAAPPHRIRIPQFASEAHWRLPEQNRRYRIPLFADPYRPISSDVGHPS